TSMLTPCTISSITRSEVGEQPASVRSHAGLDHLLKTGGTLSVKLANDILRYYTGDPRRSVLSAVSLDLFQPLLRGFGHNNAAVESLTQAQRNVIYAIRNFGFSQKDCALEIVND